MFDVTWILMTEVVEAFFGSRWNAEGNTHSHIWELAYHKKTGLPYFQTGWVYGYEHNESEVIKSEKNKEIRTLKNRVLIENQKKAKKARNDSHIFKRAGYMKTEQAMMPVKTT